MAEISLVAIGDCLLEAPFLKHSSAREFYELFNESDIFTFNLETSVTNLEGRKADKAFAFKTTPENLNEFIKNLGNVVVPHIANNHILDYGEECMMDTINQLDNKNLSFTGYSASEALESGIVFKVVKGLKIAFLGGYTGGEPENKGIMGINNHLVKKTEYAKSKADVVILNLHWGRELSLIYSPKQKKMAHRLVDAGADIIIGHHPHVLQPIETYRNAIIAYSLGNFQIMDYEYYSFSSIGGILRVNINSAKELNYELIPIKIKNRIPSLVKDKRDSNLFQYIMSYGRLLSEYNSHFLYLTHISKPFFLDSYKAWKSRADKRERNIKRKFIFWHFNFYVLSLILFRGINLFFNPLISLLVKYKYRQKT